MLGPEYLDVTPEICLSAFVCIKSVLVPVKATSIESDSTSVLADGNSLRSNTKSIFYVDIVHSEVIFMHSKSTTRIIRACLSGVNPSLKIRLIIFIICSVSRVTIDLEKE